MKKPFFSLPMKASHAALAKTLRHHAQAGYSLIELALVLLCASAFMMLTMKGRHLLENISLKKVSSYVETFRTAVQSFEETYGSLPGNFSRAQETWHQNSLKNGAGDGILKDNGQESSEATQFWLHLAAAGYTKAPTCKISPQIWCHASPIGGVFSISTNLPHHPGLWITLGEHTGKSFQGPLVTPEQAQKLLYYAQNAGNSAFGNEDIVITEGEDCEPGTCIKDGRLNVAHTQKACVVHFLLRP